MGAPALRVMHIGKYFPPHRGGMENYLGDLLHIQSAQGLKVTAVVHSSKRRFSDRWVEGDDAATSGAYQIIEVARWANIGFIPISPFFLISIRSAIKKFRPDVLHLHHPNSSLIWLLLLKSARGIPWISHWHSDIVTPSSRLIVKLAYFFYRPLESALLGISKVVIATSSSYLASSVPLRKSIDKAVVQPLGIDLDKLPTEEMVRPIERPPEPLVLAVGRMARYKAFDNLIHAVAMLPSVYCWLVGTGTELARLQQLAKNLGIEKRVEFRGAADDEALWSHYLCSDVFVLPSSERTEAFGLVLLEAGYFGLPIVATNIEGSGAPWVASQFSNNILVAPNSAKEIALGIERALAAADKTKSISRQSLNQFDLKQQASRLTELYRSLLSDS